MTGETGAGKSILVGALGLLLGRRSTPDMVRAGAEEAEVSAFFNLDEPEIFTPLLEPLGFEVTEEIVLRRVVTAAGRSRAYFNGSPIPQAQLAVIGEELLSISGQHDQQSLLKSASQLQFLDRFGGHRELLDDMRSAWQALGKISGELKALEHKLKDAEDKRDLYEFQRDELKKAALIPGEDSDLLEEKSRAKDGGRLLECLAAAAEALGNEPGNVVEKLGRVRRNLEKAAEIDPRFEEALNLALDSYHQLADLAVELEGVGHDLDVDPDRMEWVDERLNSLAKLKRKYNMTLAELIERQGYLTDLLNQLDGAGLDLARLRRDHAAALEKALAAAQKLHLARVESSDRLAALLVKSLKPLGFPRIEMRVAVEGPPEKAESAEAEKRLGPGGYDRVEFLFCPNPGEGMKPLSKIASGGELSRVMLALKTVQDRPGDQLLVFDEIDSGLGGATAEAVAAKMADLARRQQVIVITHLPQMAALAGRHFVVAKEPDLKAGRTFTSITALSDSRRVEELARMLGGASPSPEAVALAERLLAAGGEARLKR